MNQLVSLKFKNYLPIITLHSHSTLFPGDFSMSFSNKNMKDPCDIFELNHPIKDPTCLKGSSSSHVDNFYTNKKTTFFNTSTVEARIPEHHSLICTMLRLT